MYIKIDVFVFITVSSSSPICFLSVCFDLDPSKRWLKREERRLLSSTDPSAVCRLAEQRRVLTGTVGIAAFCRDRLADRTDMRNGLFNHSFHVGIFWSNPFLIVEIENFTIKCHQREILFFFLQIMMILM